ncbi:4228_t:CDS:1, partial [Racocetra fulgida]
MEEGNLLSSSSVQSFDESLTNQPDSPSDENENETSERLGRNGGSKKKSWVWKYFESEKVVEEKSNIEVTYSTCNVLNDSSIKCNAQLKIVGG